MTTPINPVTIRTSFVDSSNLSVGRLWIGTDKVSDGSYRFNPNKPKQQWAKPVSFVIWSDLENATSMLTSEEADYIATVNKLVSKDVMAVTIWGKEVNSDDAELRAVVFERNKNELKVQIINEQKESLAVSLLEFDRFLRGMSHLFPKGEIS